MILVTMLLIILVASCFILNFVANLCFGSWPLAVISTVILAYATLVIFGVIHCPLLD